MLRSSGLLACQWSWRLAKGRTVPNFINTFEAYTHCDARYFNMDYILMSAVLAAGILTLIASYDIACQWIKNLWIRMEQLPERLRLQIPPSNVIAKIPKFHFDSHGKKNHAQYSFAYTRGVGRTDGEGIERQWSGMKGGATQTIKMGPGVRRNTLDDFCGFSNWRKMIGLGE
jgi:Kyakuja-Dileera-Zisupton transposase